MTTMKQPASIFSPYEEDLILSAPGQPTSDENDSKLRKNLTIEFGIQDSKMDVYLRIRPLTSKEKSKDNIKSCIEIQSKKEVLLKAPTSSATFKNNLYNVNRLNTQFTFTEAFPAETTQKDFYLTAVDKTVQDFLNGQNCLIFAYGATNSGKTHTVQGPQDDPGVVPLTLEVIFDKLKENLMESPKYRPISSTVIEELTMKQQNIDSDVKDSLLTGLSEGYFYSSKDAIASSQESVNMFEDNGIILSSKVSLTEEMGSDSLFLIYVSFAEIYNEQIFDLLSLCSDPKKRPRLNLVSDLKGNPYVKGLRKIWVSSLHEAQRLMHLGRKNLHMAATKLNQQSSRSHCVFTIYVIRVVHSKSALAYVTHLSFCDLAGSERVVKTKNSGDRLKEAGNINTSLMVLGRCIDVLRNNQGCAKEKSVTVVVPYRDSKLTRLFQSFFNGQGKASMIVNVAPSSDMFDDTIKVLKFSALAQQVETKDKTDHSILNISSISERLTNFWVKSNRRWSSIEAHCAKQSIMTIPEASDAEIETIEEFEEDNDDEEEEIQDLMHDIREWSILAKEQDEKIKQLEEQNQELENQVAEVAKQTKDEAYEFFREHMKTVELNHKEDIERREDIANDMLNKRTKLFEEYIAKITRKSDTSEEEENLVDDTDEGYDELFNKFETLQTAHEDMKQKYREIEEMAEKLQGEITLTQCQNIMLEKSISALTRQNTNLEEQLKETLLYKERCQVLEIEKKDIEKKLQQALHYETPCVGLESQCNLKENQDPSLKLSPMKVLRITRSKSANKL